MTPHAKIKGLTRRAVQHWLESLPPNSEAGLPNHITSCPLCNYMKSLGAKKPHFLFREYSDGTGTYSIPKWAENFQIKMCKEGELFNNTFPVTVAKALDCLRHI